MRMLRGLACAVTATLAGCAVGPRYRAPDPAAPAAFASVTTDVAAQPVATDSEIANWWHRLADPELDRLVERAVSGNTDIAIALARLQQARAYEAAIVGRALPEVDATGAAGRGTGSDLTRGRAAQPLVSADSTQGLKQINALAGFDATWELDVFGRYRRAYEAAHADSAAAIAARNTVVAAVVADVVRGYVDLRGLQTETAILEKAQATLAESLRIVRIRYERGITNELDVTLATRELAAVEAELPPLRAASRAAAYTLATLTGAYPEALAAELDAPAMVPAMPGAVAPGLPLEVLKRRPDVQEAERSLAAASARIGVATAALFPTIGVIGAIGVERQGWGTTPDASRHIWSFGPGAIWPVLDLGTLDAQLTIAKLDMRVRLETYRSTIFNAVREVDTAADDFDAAQLRLKKLDDGVAAASRAVDLASERYDRGLTDFLNLVDAERTLYDLERAYVHGQVAEGEAYVALYKGLGGGWQNYQDVPAAHRPLPAVVAAFREVLAGRAP
jgi:NodT family efflux transporter outer membrane factor (OMF) lipoprotein